MVAVARLVVIAGGVGALTLRSGEYKIGRGAECDLILDDRKVSRFHASVTVAEGTVKVVDHGSRNGTYVDGDRIIGDRLLERGSQVAIGDTVCVFERIGPDVDECSTYSGSPGVESRPIPISPAEELVFELLLAGHSEKAIAARLNLSKHTVHNHVKRIYQAFDVHSRPELLARVLIPRNRNR